MRGSGRPDLYSHFIGALDNGTLYAPEAVARLGEELGLCPAQLDEAERQEYLRNAAHAFVMRAGRKLRNQVDSVDRSVPSFPRDTYLGIRWKTTIPERFLSQNDLVAVRRFKNELPFREAFRARILGVNGFRPEDPPADSEGLTVLSLVEAPAEVAEPRPHEPAFEVPIWFRMPALRIPLWPLLLVLGLASLVTWRYLADPRHEIQRLIQRGELASLRALVEDPNNSLYLPQVLAGISEIQSRRMEWVPVYPDLQGLMAVFAVPRQPCLVFDSRVLRLGDPLNLADHLGYIGEINPRSLLLVTEAGSLSFAYPKLLSFGATRPFSAPITVYPQSNNLMMVLQSIGQVSGLNMKGQAFSGSIAGTFEALDYTSFLNLVKADLGLRVQAGEITWNHSDPWSIRMCLGFAGCLPYRETTVAEVLNEYEYLLQMNLVLTSSLSNQAVGFPNCQFADFLNQLHLKVRLQSPTLMELMEAS